jgi:hypothetical protein
METYGFAIGHSVYKPLCDVVAAPEATPAGNVVLRVGTEHEGTGWSQDKHVVLTPDEVGEFACGVLTACTSRKPREAMYERALAERDRCGMDLNDTAVRRLVDSAIG